MEIPRLRVFTSEVDILAELRQQMSDLIALRQALCRVKAARRHPNSFGRPIGQASRRVRQMPLERRGL